MVQQIWYEYLISKFLLSMDSIESLEQFQVSLSINIEINL